MKMYNQVSAKAPYLQLLMEDKEQYNGKITATFVEHRGEKRIALRFSYNRKLIEKVRLIKGAQWSKTMGCWHIPDLVETRHKLLKELNVKPVAENYNHSTTNTRSKFGFKTATIIEIDEFNQQIYLTFPFKEEIKNAIKKLSGAWWHVGLKKWSVHFTNLNLDKLEELFKQHNLKFTTSYIQQPKKRQKFSREPIRKDIVPKKFTNEMKVLNKSENTIRQYVSAISGLLDYYKNKLPEQILEEEIKEYIIFYRDQMGYSTSFQNILVNAIKLFYYLMYKKEIDTHGFRPKCERKLPKVISKEEVEKMVQSTINPKQRLVLLLLYGCGLRLGEVTNLKLEDIDITRRQLIIVNAKGRKDRMVGLPQNLIERIVLYIRDYAPKVYLFNGQRKLQYSKESVGRAVKRAATKGGIRKRVTPHILRHCYATHMLERGINLRYIQYTLGHKSSRTTEMYTHISNKGITDIGSPLDDINL